MASWIRRAVVAVMVAAAPAMAGPQGNTGMGGTGGSGTTGTGGAGTGGTGVRKEQAGPQTGGRMQGLPFDERELLEILHADNQREITLGQLALQKAQTEGARQVAQSIIRDHQRADQQLTSIAKEKGFTLRAPTIRSDQVNKHKQAMEAADALLRSVDPALFDSLYLSQMVFDHDHSRHMVILGQQQFSGSTRSFLEGLAPVLQRHRDLAYRALGEVKVSGVGVGGAGFDEEREIEERR